MLMVRTLVTLRASGFMPDRFKFETVPGLSHGVADKMGIQLSDGRMLAFSDYGIPDGKPIFSVRLFRLAAGSAGPRAGRSQARLRLISVDRPGYSLSDFTQTHTLATSPGNLSS